MTDEEPEESFTFRDRRRVNTDAPSSVAVEPAPAVAVAPSPASEVADSTPPSEIDEADDLAFGDEDFGGAEGSSELPDVYSVLALFLSELRNLAWLRMGLVANPATGQIERDLAQARVAIDTVEFLASKLDTVVSAEERPALKSLVQDLQINFVEQGRRGV